jgi:hypothetical protein
VSLAASEPARPPVAKANRFLRKKDPLVLIIFLIMVNKKMAINSTVKFDISKDFTLVAKCHLKIPTLSKSKTMHSILVGILNTSFLY